MRKRRENYKEMIRFLEGEKRVRPQVLTKMRVMVDVGEIAQENRQTMRECRPRTTSKWSSGSRQRLSTRGRLKTMTWDLVRCRSGEKEGDDGCSAGCRTKPAAGGIVLYQSSTSLQCENNSDRSYCTLIVLTLQTSVHKPIFLKKGDRFTVFNLKSTKINHRAG